MDGEFNIIRMSNDIEMSEKLPVLWDKVRLWLVNTWSWSLCVLREDQVDSLGNEVSDFMSKDFLMTWPMATWRGTRICDTLIMKDAGFCKSYDTRPFNMGLKSMPCPGLWLFPTGPENHGEEMRILRLMLTSECACRLTQTSFKIPFLTLLDVSLEKRHTYYKNNGLRIWI